MIFPGDCRDWLKHVPDDSFDHCVMDPPYSERVHTKSMRSRTYNGSQPDTFELRDLGFDPLTDELRDEVSRELGRLVRRWVLVFCDSESDHLWHASLAAAGLEVVRNCIWVKPNAAPQFTGDRPGCGYETIVTAHRPGKKKWNCGGRLGVFTYPIETGSYGRDRVHTTQKPLPLMLDLVKSFTDPDELVIDPFAGSGTTGIACLRTDRDFYGAEKDPAMAAIARARLDAEQRGSSLADERRGQTALFGGAK